MLFVLFVYILITAERHADRLQHHETLDLIRVALSHLSRARAHLSSSIGIGEALQSITALSQYSTLPLLPSLRRFRTRRKAIQRRLQHTRIDRLLLPALRAAHRIIRIQLAHQRYARRQPLLERLGDEVSVGREPAHDGRLDYNLFHGAITGRRGIPRREPVQRVVFLRFRRDDQLLSVARAGVDGVFFHVPHPVREGAVQGEVDRYGGCGVVDCGIEAQLVVPCETGAGEQHGAVA